MSAIAQPLPNFKISAIADNAALFFQRIDDKSHSTYAARLNMVRHN
ncbi:MAG TPA: hypothetical protein V6D09_14500 [Leptolyngbyaceae cyanobacterium]